MVQIEKTQLKYWEGEVNGLIFHPNKSIRPKSIGLLTHGYTSQKESILNWAVRLSEEGMPCLLFDLPGHYLGSFNEVTNFEEFCASAHKLFVTAYEKMSSYQHNECKLFLAGHSLGALLALKALNQNELKDISKSAAVVGLGMPPTDQVHIFKSPFYKSTLNIRGQLVSPALDPDRVFPWIAEEKRRLELQSERVHFITGKDDVVVGDTGSEEMAKLLQNQGNDVSLERPNRLPHNLPDMAASHIKKWAKELQLF